MGGSYRLRQELTAARAKITAATRPESGYSENEVLKLREAAYRKWQELEIARRCH